jgi:uncharacterized membrane protein YhaH (DUF805 family)
MSPRTYWKTIGVLLAVRFLVGIVLALKPEAASLLQYADVIFIFVAAVVGRRLRDIGVSPVWGWIAVALIAEGFPILLILNNATAGRPLAIPPDVGGWLGYAPTALLLALVVTAGMWKGDKRANRFGEPLAVAVPETVVQTPVEKARQIVRAVSLIWIGIALDTVVMLKSSLFFALSDLTIHQILVKIIAELVMYIVPNGIMGYLAMRIYAGKYWAVIVFIAVFLIRYYLILGVIPSTFQNSWFDGSVKLAEFALGLYAMVLILTNPGRAWFGKPSPAAAP